MAEIFRPLNIFKREPLSHVTAINSQSYLKPFVSINLVDRTTQLRDPLITRYSPRDPSAAINSQINVWQNRSPSTTPSASPFSQDDWPIPRGYTASIALRTWTDNTKINLIGKDRIYGGPGQTVTFDYPNPRGPQYPTSLRTYIQATPLVLVGQDRIYGGPGQVPTREYLNPRGRLSATVFDPPNLLNNTLSQVTTKPFSQTDWPTPSRSRSLSWPNYDRGYFTEPSPFRQGDWPVPRGYTAPIALKTWLDETKIELIGKDRVYGEPGQVPDYEWPVPRSATPAIVLKTWLDPTRLNLVGGLAGSPNFDWPVPRGPQYPSSLRTFLNPTPIQLVGQDRIYAGPGQVPPYDYPNPYPARRIQVAFELTDNCLLIVSQQVPFYQTDWPVPKGYIGSISLKTWTDNTKINLIGQDTVYGDRGQVSDYEWVVPKGQQYPISLRTHLNPTQIQLLGQDSIYDGPGRVPPYEYPNPRGAIPSIALRTWIQTPGQDYPVVPIDWTVPKAAQYPLSLRAHIHQTPINLIGSDRIYNGPGQVPVYDYPNPRGYVGSISLKTWLDTTNILLIGQDRVYGDPGEVPSYDWPDPRGAQYPISLRATLSPTNIQLIGQDRVYGDPGQVPTYDFPVPKGPYPTNLRTYLNTTQIQLIGQDVIYGSQGQVPDYDWPNPRGYTYPISLRTHINQTLIGAVPSVPVPTYDWPNPRGYTYPTSLRAHINPTPIQLIGSDRIYGDPGQAATYDYPNPRGRLFQILFDPADLLNTTLQVTAVPFSQTDWPVPRGRQSVQFDHRNNTLLQIPPFVQTDWPVSPAARSNIQRGWIDPTKINLIGQDRIYSDPGEVPPYDYPNPTPPRSNILRGWIDTTKINLIGQDRIYNGPGQVPSYDWTNPVLRKPQNTTFFEATNLLSTVLQVKPFSQTDWPVPSGAITYTLRNWIDPTKINLIGQDTIYGDPGEVPSYDWPNPNRVRREIISYEFSNNLLLQTVFPKPFLQTDWPVPYGKVGSVSLKTWTDNTKIQLIGQDIVYGERGQVPTHVLPNPRGPQRLVVGTFDLSTPYVLQNTPPINPEIREHNWPNPRGPEYPYSALSYTPPNLYPLFSLPQPIPPEPVAPVTGGLPPRRPPVDVVVSGIVLPLRISLIPGKARSISLYPGVVRIDAVATPLGLESINIVFTKTGKPIVSDSLQDDMEELLLILSQTLLE